MRQVNMLLFGVKPVAHAWCIEQAIQQPIRFTKWQPGDPSQPQAAALGEADAAVAMI